MTDPLFEIYGPIDSWQRRCRRFPEIGNFKKRLLKEIARTDKALKDPQVAAAWNLIIDRGRTK